MEDREKMKKVCNNIILYGVMLVYVLILFLLLFHKRRAGSFQGVNLVPFHTIRNYLFPNDLLSKAFGVSNLLGNIIIFIPLGIYITLLNRKKQY